MSGEGQSGRVACAWSTPAQVTRPSRISLDSDRHDPCGLRAARKNGVQHRRRAVEVAQQACGCRVDRSRHSTSAEESPSRCPHAVHLRWPRASCVQHVGRVSRVVVVGVSSSDRWAEADCEWMQPSLAWQAASASLLLPPFVAPNLRLFHTPLTLIRRRRHRRSGLTD